MRPLVFIALFAVSGCVHIDHPYDDPNRDECAREQHGRLSRNCPDDPLKVPFQSGNVSFTTNR